MNLQKHMSTLLGKNDVQKSPPATPKTADEPRRSELGLSVSEVLKCSLDGNKNLGYVIFHPDQSVMTISPAFKALLNMSETDATNLRDNRAVLDYVASLGAPETRPSPAVIEEINRRTVEQMSKREDVNRTRTEKLHDGRILQFRSKFTTMGHLISYVSDVTELTERDIMLRHGLTLGTSGYWAINYQTGQSDFSNYIEDVLSETELEQTRINGLLAVVHKDDLERASIMFLECRSNQSRMDGQFRIVTQKRGVMWVRVIGEFQYCDDGHTPLRFIAFINDVTADVQNQEELRGAQELSRVKTDFLARMSHEIKTPLNAIVGMTDALLGEVDNDEARETANYIADAAQNLDRVLSQTLEHARLSSTSVVLDVHECDPKTLVQSTAALFKKPCKDKGINLTVRIAPSMPSVIQTDSTRLRQCLTNLLSNAVKFTDSGQITVALAPVQRPDGTPNIVLAVKDTGIGMSDNAAKNIFKPFAQADQTISRRFGGAGLGMAITSQIVEAMGGTIRVKSELGSGTIISISAPLNLEASLNGSDTQTKKTAAKAKSPVDAVLPTTARPSPVIAQEPAPAATAPTATPALAASTPEATTTESTPVKTTVNKKVPIDPTAYSGFDVLVVEDNPINQKVVGKLLAGHVRSVTFAFHGDEALKILQRQTYDVILMDIHMPIKDGIETTLEIRNSGETWADIVIVALTADPDYQQKRICRNIGMNDTIAKPVRRQELLEAMARVLDERDKLRQAVA